MKAQHLVALALLASGSAAAADSYSTAAATAASNPVISKIWVDKNADGMIQKEELASDSQLYKRFATRDTNNDGTLTKDEYFY
jgi:hypothetical protein